MNQSAVVVVVVLSTCTSTVEVATGIYTVGKKSI